MAQKVRFSMAGMCHCQKVSVRMTIRPPKIGLLKSFGEEDEDLVFLDQVRDALVKINFEQITSYSFLRTPCS